MLKKIIVCLSLVCCPFMIFPEQFASNEKLSEEVIEAFSELSEKEKEQTIQFFSLNWETSGRHKLPASNSSLSIPESYMAVFGDDAIKEREINDAVRRKNVEAVVYADDFENIIIFENIDSGYVSIEDWSDLDPKVLLDAIIENTKNANIERKKNNCGQIHVVGWMLEPTLDKHTNTVYWAIEGRSEEEGDIVNSIALRLGRQGYERIIWVSKKDSYTPFGGHLDVMLRAHSFDPGYKYTDYTNGDRIAGYGVATLVAASVGGKIVKAGGLIAIFKKLGGFFFALVAGIAYKIKGIFKRGE